MNQRHASDLSRKQPSWKDAIRYKRKQEGIMIDKKITRRKALAGIGLLPMLAT